MLKRLAIPALLALALAGAGPALSGPSGPVRPPRTAGLLSIAEAATTAYDWPLQPTRPVSSSFGEYRRNHFHGGIDFSTDGRTGLPVHAVADGWAWRVRASGSGYGRSLYLRLTDGRTVVYAHLDRFAPAIQAFVEAAQESLGQYEVDLRPEPGRFDFHRGEVVAWSGESGAGPAHLHFEVREGGEADIGLNPRWIGFADPDSTVPTIRRLIVAPIGAGSRVEGQPGRMAYDVFERGRGLYRLARAPRIEGAARFSIEAWDPAPRGNRLAVSRARLSRGGRILFDASLERFTWDRAHDVERFYDQSEADQGRRFVVHLYRPAGPESPLFGQGPADRGLLDRRSAGEAGDSVEVRVEDAAGHVSRLTWTIPAARVTGSGAAPDTFTLPAGGLTGRWPALGLAASVTPDGVILAAPVTGGLPATLLTIPDVDPPAPPAWWERLLGREAPRVGRGVRLQAQAEGAPASLIDPPARFVVRPLALTRRSLPGGLPEYFLDTLAVIGIVRGGPQELRFDALTVTLPEGAAFGPAWIGVTVAPAEPLAGLAPVSPVCRWMAPGLVFDRPVRLALAPPTGVDTTHAALYVRDAGGDWNWVGATRGPDGIGGETRYPGDLALFRDLDPPRIAIGAPPPGGRVGTDRPVLRATISDVGSGFGWRQIETTLDGVPQIVVWDPESASLTGRSRRHLAGGGHRLIVRVRDRAGNWSEVHADFRVTGR